MSERIMPHNLEAEKSVIGATFLSKYALQKANEELDSSDFYDDKLASIFSAINYLHEQKTAIDITTLSEYLDRKKQLNKVGGIEYITEVINSVPTAANVDYYIKIVAEKALLRRLIDTSTQIIDNSYNNKDEVNEVIDDAEKKILGVVKDRKSTELQKIQSVLFKTQSDLEKLSELETNITGVTSGFKAIDKLTSGYHPNELTIIAARPGMGKTAFALNVATNVAMTTTETVAIFTLEMGAEQLASRMISNVGEVEFNKLRTGNLSTDDWHKINEAISRLAETNIYIDDTPGITVNEIRSKCRRLATSENGLGMIIIDYLQLIGGSSKYAGNRQQEVSEISRTLKTMALELGVPVIALAQLSRQVEGREDKKPLLSDLRESGSIEQDADVVSFLYRDAYYSRDEEEKKNNSTMEYIIAKHRNGPTDTVELKFINKFMAFRSFYKQ